MTANIKVEISSFRRFLTDITTAMSYVRITSKFCAPNLKFKNVFHLITKDIDYFFRIMLSRVLIMTSIVSIIFIQYYFRIFKIFIKSICLYNKKD